MRTRFASFNGPFLVVSLTAFSLISASSANAQSQQLASATPIIKSSTPGQPASLLTPEAAAREAEHVSRFDQAIAPIRDYPVSAEDVQRIRDAIAAYAANDVSKGRPLRDQISDATGRKLVDWYRLRAGLGDAAEYRAFLDANPAWPERTLLTQRLEEALFIQGGTARTIKDALGKTEPRTGAGFAALASAHLAENDEATARTLAVKAWRELDIPATLEKGFLDRFGRFLTEADHKWRFDRLLIDDSRWATDRAPKAAVARRVVPLLSKPEQQKAEARLAVFTKSNAATKLMTALPADATADWGLAYQQVQVLRRQNKNEDAWKILLSAPTGRAQIVSPDDWWTERRAAAYDALAAGKPTMALDLIRDAGELTVNPRKEQMGLAGWIALRHLNDPRLALGFFKTMRDASDGPLSVSRAEYWLGRANEAIGEKAKAQQNYKAASQHYDTFYGQLAMNKIEPGAQALPVRPPASPSKADIDSFTQLDAVKAAVIAHKASLDVSIERMFLMQLQRSLKSEAEVAMLAHLAQAMKDTQASVRIGKAAIARGFNLVYYAYPVHAFPTYSPLRTPPETAFLLGIARQESEFNGRIVSGAGARGILQVMPVTAKHVCRDYKVKCDIGRLLTDPSYNTMMASAYIGDRMAEFSGSYVLTLAGYNAGPGRTRQWIREFGDPRTPGVDPIDWITRIPFEETREYVQKVLSNIQVYRARLGDEQALRVASDLSRARAGSPPQQDSSSGG